MENIETQKHKNDKTQKHVFDLKLESSPPQQSFRTAMQDEEAQAQAGAEALQKSKQGLVSGVAESVMKIANPLRYVPSLAAIANPAYYIAGAVGGIAKQLGYGYPLNQESRKPMVLDQFNYSHGQGLATSTQLSLAQESCVKPLALSLWSKDEMRPESLLTHRQLVSAFQIAPAAANTLVWSHLVHPLAVPEQYLGDNVRSLNVDHTMSSHFCNLFQLWRGSMMYSLHIFASSFHSARIRISWLPNDMNPTRFAGDSLDLKYNLPGMIVDIRGNDVINFSVPFLMGEFYAKSSLNEIMYAGEILRQSVDGFSLAATMDAYEKSQAGRSVFNGTIFITIENEVTFPTTPVPLIQCLLFQGCGSDMQLKQPTTASFSNVPGVVRTVTGTAPKLNTAGSGLNILYGEACEHSDLGDVVPTLVEAIAQSGVEGEAMLTETTLAPQVEETTVFYDPVPVITTDEATTDPVVPMFNLQEIRDFCRRPMPIFRHNWASTDTPGKAYIIDPLSLYLRLPAIQRKFANYRFLRADVVVQVRINGTKFHYGAWGLSSVPMNATSFSDYWVESAVRLTGFPGGIMTPDMEDTMEVRLPFIFNKPYFAINQIGWYVPTNPKQGDLPPDNGSDNSQNSNYVNNGTLWSYALTPLAGATVTTLASVPPVSLTYYAWLENIELEGFTDDVYTVDARTVEETVIRIPQAVTWLSGTSVRTSTAAEYVFTYPGFGDERPTLLDEALAQGFGYQEEIDAKPIIPCNPQAASDDVMHGDSVSHLKQLTSRPVPMSYANAVMIGMPPMNFYSYHGHFRNLINERDLFRGNVNKDLRNCAYPQNIMVRQPTWAEALSPLYLGTRGSFRMIMPGTVQSSGGILVALTSKNMWNVRLTNRLTDTGGVNPNPDKTSTSNTNGYFQDRTLGSAASFCIAGAATTFDVTIPWYSDSSFCYIPRPTPSDGARNYAVLPRPTLIPGIQPLTVANSNLNWMATSAGDDFQFVGLIPPRCSVFTLAMNSTTTLSVDPPQADSDN